MDKTLSDAIKNDLYNELRWLLCAATEWDAYVKLIDEPPPGDKMKEPCSHLKLYTMDSAFVHARSLYEFFTATEKSIKDRKKAEQKAKSKNKRNQSRLTWYDYSTNPAVSPPSPLYTQFIEALHGRVMHLDLNRSGYDEIKKEVVNFAQDILDLWNAFSKHPDLSDYRSLLDKFRDNAIKEAERVAGQYSAHGYQSPFSSK